MARILIIGGAGFIGSHLARHCIRNGDGVHIAVRPKTDKWRLKDLLSSLQIHTANLGQMDEARRLVSDASPDLIYYLAAQTKHVVSLPFEDVFSSINNDVLPLMNTLAASATSSVKKVVRAASLAEYGNGPAPFVETQREKPLTAYAAGMATATQYCQMVQPRLPFPVVHARLGLTYGPAQSESFLIPSTIKSCLAQRKTVLRRPNDRRDLIYVDDVAAGLRSAAETDIPGGTIFNLATGLAPTMRNVTNEIAELCGIPPGMVLEDEQPDSQFTTSDLRASTEFAQSVLSWRPVTKLTDGLRQTIEAFRQDSRDLGKAL